MERDHPLKPVLLLRGSGGLDPTGQVERVPADGAVLDVAVAAFGNLLFAFPGMRGTPWIFGCDGPGEAVRELDPVELHLDCPERFGLIDVSKADSSAQASALLTPIALRDCWHPCAFRPRIRIFSMLPSKVASAVVRWADRPGTVETLLRIRPALRPHPPVG